MKQHSLEAARAFSHSNFSAIDVVIVVVYLAVSLLIGILVRRFAKDMTAYIGAGRRIGTWLGVASMLGTEMGLITVMYSAQKGFTGGFAAFHMAVIAGVTTLWIGASGFIVVPLRKLKVLTIPEYYETRFNKKTRVLGGIMLAFAGILNMGLFLKVGSQFIVGITGLSSSGWALPAVMVSLLVLVLIYTTCGGMISVILTDYVQFVVLSFGVLAVTLIAVFKLGWANIFSTVRDTLGQAGFNPMLEESGYGWSYVLWMFITAGLVGAAIWPTAVARALAMKSTRELKQNYLWSSISFTVRFMIPNFLGICALVYISSSSDAGDLKELFFPADGSPGFDNIYAMPVFLGRLIPPVMIGLITAAMIAAFMSTHDSYFLCWSSVITQDIVAPLRRNGLSEKARIALTRWTILAIGLYVLYWGLVYKGNEHIWDYMAITGSIYFNGAIAVLAGGLYWKKASSSGAFAALLAGFTAVLGLSPVQNFLHMTKVNPETNIPEPILSGAEAGLCSMALVFFAMIVFSLLFPDKNQNTSSKAGIS